jgi:DNA-binding IclR family transcriptional regulator
MVGNGAGSANKDFLPKGIRRVSGGYQVPAVVSAVSILRELTAAGEQGVTQAELVRTTGISKSTMHNLLSTLEDEGMVVRDDRNRDYRLGPLLIMLGAAASGHTRLVTIASDWLTPLAAERGLSFAIAQRVGDTEAVIVDRMLPAGLHVGVTIGTRYGPFDGALGKCLLAGLPAAEAEALIRERPSLPEHTARSITSPDEMLAEVERTRQRGWAASDQEFNENRAVSAIVKDRSGRTELLLLALGFADSLGEDQIEATGELLVDVARSVRAAAGIADDELVGTAPDSE